MTAILAILIGALQGRGATVGPNGAVIVVALFSFRRLGR
jgi:hypothetical protein